MRIACVFVLTITAAIAATIAQAQTAGRYPERPVRIIVPLAAGGNADIVARGVAQQLSENLGRQVIVENRPSASSLVGTQFVAKAAPDGYTLLAVANGFTMGPAFIANPGYDPLTEFAGISLTGMVPEVLVVNPSLPVRSVKELIALAKSRPGQISYGSAGTGSIAHISTELFNQRVGVKMLHVPYSGGSQALIDVIGGQIMLLFVQVSSLESYVKSGRLRALAVTSRTRSPLLPDLPTLDESGLPGYDDVTYTGLAAPANTPRAILVRLNEEISRVVRMPNLQSRFLAIGVELKASGSPEEFTAYIKAEVDKNFKIARTSGIKLN